MNGRRSGAARAANLTRSAAFDRRREYSRDLARGCTRCRDAERPRLSVRYVGESQCEHLRGFAGHIAPVRPYRNLVHPSLDPYLQPHLESQAPQPSAADHHKGDGTVLVAVEGADLRHGTYASELGGLEGLVAGTEPAIVRVKLLQVRVHGCTSNSSREWSSPIRARASGGQKPCKTRRRAYSPVEGVVLATLPTWGIQYCGLTEFLSPVRSPCRLRYASTKHLFLLNFPVR